MIPKPFEYARPATVDEAVRLLAEGGRQPKVLAGGQSLVPMLRRRRISPDLVVDINHIPGLRGIREEAGSLVIGAVTTHHDVLHDDLVRRHAPLLAIATKTLGDPAVRHRGTFGGSIAHADPVGDLLPVVLALQGELTTESPRGRRKVPAARFFDSPLRTVLDPDEILVEIRVPKFGESWGFQYEKLQLCAQNSTLAGVAVAIRRSSGRIAEARIGLTRRGSTPLRAFAAEAALVGVSITVDTVGEAAEMVAEGIASTPSDRGVPLEYVAHIVRVLTYRAILSATESRS